MSEPTKNQTPDTQHSVKGAMLEHVNITVANPKETAAMLCRMFDWNTRWEGASMANGYTVHVGTEHNYVALYRSGNPTKATSDNYKTRGGLNHIAVVVDDLDATEQRVIAEGQTPHNHGSYEPGRRFYFIDNNDVEYEVVSYS